MHGWTPECEDLLAEWSEKAWDVSQVTDMSELFKECWKFNQPIGGWRMLGVCHYAFFYASIIGTSQAPVLRPPPPPPSTGRYGTAHASGGCLCRVRSASRFYARFRRSPTPACTAQHLLPFSLSRDCCQSLN